MSYECLRCNGECKDGEQIVCRDCWHSVKQVTGVGLVGPTNVGHCRFPNCMSSTQGYEVCRRCFDYVMGSYGLNTHGAVPKPYLGSSTSAALTANSKPSTPHAPVYHENGHVLDRTARTDIYVCRACVQVVHTSAFGLLPPCLVSNLPSPGLTDAKQDKHKEAAPARTCGGCGVEWCEYLDGTFAKDEWSKTRCANCRRKAGRAA